MHKLACQLFTFVRVVLIEIKYRLFTKAVLVYRCVGPLSYFFIAAAAFRTCVNTGPYLQGERMLLHKLPGVTATLAAPSLL